MLLVVVRASQGGLRFARRAHISADRSDGSDLGAEVTGTAQPTCLRLALGSACDILYYDYSIVQYIIL